jgi:aminocarboxymuconate-semialdehyde decarboxylase
MPIDVHAHYVPPAVLETLRDRGADYGVSVTARPPACSECLEFAYGLQVRPFFPRLLEDAGRRVEHMERQGITKQVLSIWTDIFGYGIDSRRGTAWHRLLNSALAAWCAKDRQHFAWLASGALPDAASAARELETSVRQEGAVGGVVAANVEGVNLGELNLDEYWAAATELDVPVFIHPAQPTPTPRTRQFALMNPIVQYTFDTTLAVGSLIFSGVLDRFPGLRLILSHGGGAFPYLVGRFDCLHSRMDTKATANAALHAPSSYFGRMHYDTILHSAKALRFLAESVGVIRMVIGSDDSFPPADHDPLGSLRAAGFGPAEIETIAETNPRGIFRL